MKHYWKLVEEISKFVRSTVITVIDAKCYTQIPDAMHVKSFGRSLFCCVVVVHIYVPFLLLLRLLYADMSRGPPNIAARCFP